MPAPPAWPIAARPCTLLHVDVKKLGNIPDGGDWRCTGRQQGHENRAATAFVHTVPDDHSRVAYAEDHDDETAATHGVQRRAVAWFAARG